MSELKDTYGCPRHDEDEVAHEAHDLQRARQVANRLLRYVRCLVVGVVKEEYDRICGSDDAGAIRGHLDRNNSLFTEAILHKNRLRLEIVSQDVTTIGSENKNIRVMFTNR